MDSADLQSDTIRYGASIIAAISGMISNNTANQLHGQQQIPFWFSANTWGDIAPVNNNGVLSLYAYKSASRPNRWWDYSYGVQINGRVAGPIISENRFPKPVTAYFQQLYAHCRLYIFDFTAGIKPFNTTFGSEKLSSGSLLFSSHAHSLPRISLGIDKWTSFPFTYGYLELRGGLTHAWATTYTTPYDSVQHLLPISTSDYFIHYKFLGFRLGGKLPVNISYEFHHAAQWGGISPKYGDLGNDFKSFFNVFVGNRGSANSIEAYNKQGNHLCMQQLALELRFSGIHASAYWQVLQEDGPIGFPGTTMNRYDGLLGLNISQFYFPYLQTITYEFLATTDQSGPVHDIDGFVFGGRDDYYFHSIYTQGWTYLGNTIGNPLITPDNNRVIAHHIALQGDIRTYQYRLLCTYARYYTPYDEDVSFNSSREIAFNRTSLMLEVNKKIPQAWGLCVSASLAADIYNNLSATLGGKISISKTFEYEQKKH